MNSSEMNKILIPATSKHFISEALHDSDEAMHTNATDFKNSVTVTNRQELHSLLNSRGTRICDLKISSYKCIIVLLTCLVYVQDE